MHIAFFSDTYRPTINGITTSIISFATALREQGHEVSIFGPAAPELSEDHFHGFTSVQLPQFAPDYRLGLPLSANLFRPLRKLPIDVVHCHTPGPIGLLGVTYGRLSGRPTVVTHHTRLEEYARLYVMDINPVQRLVDRMTRAFCNRFDSVIAPTEEIRKALRIAGVTKDIFVIPTGLDETLFFGERSVESDYTPGWDLSRPTVGCLCRLAAEKNLDFLIHVIKHLRTEIPEIQLVLIGEGNARQRLEKLVRELGLEETVFFAGSLPREAVPVALSSLDVFAYACRNDTQGLVVLEALACGLPLVVVDEPVFEPLVQNDQNGFREREDIDAFSDRLAWLLAHSEARTAFGEYSRALARDYGMSKQSQKLESLYESLQRDDSGLRESDYVGS